jgi:hypothetical protein
VKTNTAIPARKIARYRWTFSGDCPRNTAFLSVSASSLSTAQKLVLMSILLRVPWSLRMSLATAPIPAAELAEAASMTRRGITRVLRQLEALGWLKTEHHGRVADDGTTERIPSSYQVVPPKGIEALCYEGQDGGMDLRS